MYVLTAKSDLSIIVTRTVGYNKGKKQILHIYDGNKHAAP